MFKLQKHQLHFIFLSLIPCYFIIAGLFFDSPVEIIRGLGNIIREPDFLITDYFVIGGVGATFFNAGLLSLVSIVLIYRLGIPFDGHTITSICLMLGFSLFGKNLLNIWAVLLGVWLYARLHGTPFSRYIYIGLYGTSLSPILTQITQLAPFKPLPIIVRLLIALLCGICIGFVLPPLATHVHYAHMGYSLYNVGFACGFIAIVAVSLMKSFHITLESRLIWFRENRISIFILLAALFAVMACGALLIGRQHAWHAYQKLLKTPGVGGTDFFRAFGLCPTIINMAVNGFVSMLLIFCIGGQLNGPTIGSIFTIVGFSSTGKHLRNILPIMLGVFFASLTSSWSIQDPAAQLALLLSTTLAPIAGEFGIRAGIIAGFLHSAVSLHIGIVYSGMNLYNNGFAGGVIAVFMVPVIRSIRSRKARANEDVSL